jgi:hypothetical protein
MDFPHTSYDIKASEFRILQHCHSSYRRPIGSQNRDNRGAVREPSGRHRASANVALQYEAVPEQPARSGEKEEGIAPEYK